MVSFVFQIGIFANGKVFDEFVLWKVKSLKKMPGLGDEGKLMPEYL